MHGIRLVLGFSSALFLMMVVPIVSRAQSTAEASSRPTTLPVAPIIKDSAVSPLKMMAQVGVPFSYTIQGKNARGAVDSSASSFTANSLPAGLVVDTKTGVISGTSTEAGVFSIPISSTNASGTGTSQLLLTVYPEHPTTATTIMRLKGTTTSPFGYVEFLPKSYYLKPQATFRVVIDLTGAGNIARKATDPWGGNAQNKLWELTTQAGRTNRNGGTIFDDADCIILSPIPPDWWENVPLDQFFSFAYDHYRIDRSRVYLVGLSAGGDGVMDYVAAHGSDLAAVVFGAISHDNPPRGHDWAPFLQIPTWIYENWNDPYDGGKGNVNRRHSILFCNEMAQMLSGDKSPTDMLASFPEHNLATTQPAHDWTGVYTVGEGWKWSAGFNGDVGPLLRFTQFKTKNHGGWNQAYESREVWRWLFAQQKIASKSN